jgi:hypothetical protein
MTHRNLYMAQASGSNQIVETSLIPDLFLYSLVGHGASLSMHAQRPEEEVEEEELGQE